MGPVNFELIRTELRAEKENNEEPSQAEMFVATRTNKKGESLHSSRQEMIDYVKDLKEFGHSDDETFVVLFEKERHGQVRLYGRRVMKTSLQKDKEIEQLKQQHKDETSSVKNSFDKRMDGITCLLKGLFQQINPALSSEQLQVMIDTAQKSTTDANSTPEEVRPNVPPSSGSSYMPNIEEED
ncbi:hypothetical protein PIB30_077633 [Stylosanthes scabra]|uniref:Uncharacterized protein n=1 Tax=Stylosanthes scabra TaxID=79078 RepID=A0ABU6TQN3_9FABA|nr:hypothetical protein [Stylosanthes scabra]